MKKIFFIIVAVAAVFAGLSYYDSQPASSPVRKVFQKQYPQWSPKNLTKHWQEHRDEFPEFQTEKEYGDAAIRFFDDPPEGTERKVRGENRDRLYYHPPTNTFGVTTADGTPKTFFRPRQKMRYWKRQ